jgi:hypothetical protein
MKRWGNKTRHPLKVPSSQSGYFVLTFFLKPNQRFGGDRLCSDFPNCIESPMLYEPLLWREGLLRFFLSVCFSFCPVKGLSLLGGL